MRNLLASLAAASLIGSFRSIRPNRLAVITGSGAREGW